MRTFFQIAIYVPILGVNLLWTVLVWVFTKDMCSGTGMGSNRALVFCQDYTDLVPCLVFALNLLIFASGLYLIRVRHLGWLPHIAVILAVTVVIFALSTMIWDLPIFMWPVK